MTYVVDLHVRVTAAQAAVLDALADAFDAAGHPPPRGGRWTRSDALRAILDAGAAAEEAARRVAS